MKKILHYSLISLLSILPIFTTSCSNSVLPTVYLETNGVELPDRSDENYKDYAPSKLIYKDDVLFEIEKESDFYQPRENKPYKGPLYQYETALTIPIEYHIGSYNYLASNKKK